MGNTMRKMKRILSLVLCLCLVWTMVPQTAAAFADSETVHVLALGDSITAGYGLADSDDWFINKLGSDYTVNNKAVNGNTVAGIAVQLQDGTITPAEIAAADVITITAGGNDMMALLYAKMAEMYNEKNDPDIEPADVVTILGALNQSNLLANLPLLSCAQQLLKKDSANYLMDSAEFQAALTSYQQVLTGITTALKQVNPDVKIVIATQYNPYVDFNGVKLYNMADLTPLYAGLEDGAAQLNAVISAGAAAGGCLIADVKKAFDEAHSSTESMYNASPLLSSISLDFHPSAAGHAVMAEVFKTVMEAGLQPSNPDPSHAEITAVAVTPASADLKKGSIQSFTAEVSGTGAYSDEVVWSISGSGSAITEISREGRLFVGVDETAAEITVTAASAADETKSASVTVTVDNAFATEGLGMAYQTYLNIKEQLEAEIKSVDALKTAYAPLNDGEFTLEYEQLSVMPDDYFLTCFNANIVLYYDELRAAYQDNPCETTAYDLTKYCADLEEAEDEATVKSFFPDYDEVKAAAEQYLATENVYTVYEAYTPLREYLEWGAFIEDLPQAAAAVEELSAVMSSLTAEEVQDLAEMLGMEVSSVLNTISGDVFAAKAIAAFGLRHADIMQGDYENAQAAALFAAEYEAALKADAYTDRMKDFFRLYFETIYEEVLYWSLSEPAQSVGYVYTGLHDAYFPEEGEYDTERLEVTLWSYDPSALDSVTEADWVILLKLTGLESAAVLKEAYKNYVEAAQGIVEAAEHYYDNDYYPADPEEGEPEYDGEDSGFDRADGAAKTEYAEKFAAKYKEVLKLECGQYIVNFLAEEYEEVNSYLNSLQPAPVPGGSGYVNPIYSARVDSAEAVKNYVDLAEYDAEDASAIQSIINQAKLDLNSANTAEEIKAIEAAAKAEIDKIETAAEKAKIAEVKDVKLSAKSEKTVLGGKRAVKISWTVPKGMEFDGFDIYRSTKRYSGFGKKPFFSTTKTQYINNKNLEEGNTYYYKVRAFKYVNDEKVYTEYSNKVWRTF